MNSNEDINSETNDTDRTFVLNNNPEGPRFNENETKNNSHVENNCEPVQTETSVSCSEPFDHTHYLQKKLLPGNDYSPVRTSLSKAFEKLQIYTGEDDSFHSCNEVTEVSIEKSDTLESEENKDYVEQVQNINEVNRTEKHTIETQNRVQNEDQVFGSKFDVSTNSLFQNEILDQPDCNLIAVSNLGFFFNGTVNPVKEETKIGNCELSNQESKDYLEDVQNIIEVNDTEKDTIEAQKSAQDEDEVFVSKVDVSRSSLCQNEILDQPHCINSPVKDQNQIEYSEIPKPKREQRRSEGYTLVPIDLPSDISFSYEHQNNMFQELVDSSPNTQSNRMPDYLEYMELRLKLNSMQQELARQVHEIRLVEKEIIELRPESVKISKESFKSIMGENEPQNEKLTQLENENEQLTAKLNECQEKCQSLEIMNNQLLEEKSLASKRSDDLIRNLKHLVCSYENFKG